MGIEPTRAALPDLGNKQFGAMTIPRCDPRVNFLGTWGHKELLENTGPRLCRLVSPKPRNESGGSRRNLREDCLAD
jgi:hypothetical protein